MRRTRNRRITNRAGRRSAADRLVIQSRVDHFDPGDISTDTNDDAVARIIVDLLIFAEDNLVDFDNALQRGIAAKAILDADETIAEPMDVPTELSVPAGMVTLFQTIYPNLTVTSE